MSLSPAEQKTLASLPYATQHYLHMNNVYQFWMHISSPSLSFCQRFSEDECLQPNRTLASTR